MVKLFLYLVSTAFAQQGSITINHFSGLNDTDPAPVIGNAEAQSALNVEASLLGNSIIKREGYTREAALTVATAPVSGSFYFTCSNGDNLTIVCHNRQCAKSTNGGAFSVFLSTAGGTGTIPTRWSFVAIDGKLYGANDSRDAILQYDCTTLTSPATMPAGSLLELTEDRLIVADTSANPSRINYSQSGAYTTFTAATTSVGAWTDDIGTPGDKTTAIKYNRGRLYIFKRQSITVCLLGDQYTTTCQLLTDAVGSQDPNSIVATGDGLYFRGTDRNYWLISGNGLEILSQKISNFVKNQTSGGARNNSQTTQADWNAGSQRPSGTWDTTTSAGSIFPSSTSFLDTSGTDFASGTLTSISTKIISGSITLGVTSSTNTVFDAFTDGDFTANPVWTTAGSWTVASNKMRYDSGAGTATAPLDLNITRSQRDTYFSFRMDHNSATGISAAQITNGSNVGYQARIQGGGDSNVLLCTTTTGFNCASILLTVSFFDQNENDYLIIIRSSGSVDLYINGVGRGTADNNAYTSFTRIGLFSNAANSTFDDVSLNYYPASGNIVSRIWDTTYSTPTWGPITISTSIPSSTSLTYEVQASTDPNNTFETLVSQTNNNRISAAQRRYIRYKASFSNTISTKTPQIDSVSLAAATTGQYRTQCIQPASSISSWGIVSCAETLIGGGSLVYTSTSAATCATLPTNDPSNWATAMTNNATLTIATNTAMYVGFRSLLGSSTDQAQVDACTVYWNEGTVSQPVWGAYNSSKNSIYWTATTTASTTGDRLLKLDLNHMDWFPFDIQATALSMIGNYLYFGSSGGGYWNKFAPGGVYSDNGTNINAYWKSKDFGGADPFQETSFNRISLVARNQTTGNMTLTHTLSSGQTSNHTVSLSTTSTLGYIRDNYNIPITSPHNFINVQVGNNSATSFEVLGIRIDFNTLGWRPVNP